MGIQIPMNSGELGLDDFFKKVFGWSFYCSCIGIIILWLSHSSPSPSITFLLHILKLISWRFLTSFISCPYFICLLGSTNWETVWKTERTTPEASGINIFLFFFWQLFLKKVFAIESCNGIAPSFLESV